MNISSDFKNKLGISINSILVPNSSQDMQKWSVVACDQYTSQPDYWEKTKSLINDSPSTLNMIFPEVYLERETEEQKTNRINEINSSMYSYLESGIFEELNNTIILSERKTDNKTRKGIIVAVDLEEYDFSKDSQSLIRATEGTIIDRLPPRIKVRENAPIELPHIMLLIDDPDKTVIEPIYEERASLNKLYDFELLMNGGHIKGYSINTEDKLTKIFNSLLKLSQRNTFEEKYNVDTSKGTLLFAVGDGNHSLATAKACWETLKNNLSDEEKTNHPARFALVEIVNVHDEGLEFEPIHRVVFNTDPIKLLNKLVENFRELNIESQYISFNSKNEMGKYYLDNLNPNQHLIKYVFDNTYGVIIVKKPILNLEVGTLQSYLDDYLKQNPSTNIDYIHGDDVVEELSKDKNSIGFFLPTMNKNDLFKTVILDGALPRKTFSMGEAHEKRYYLECKKIK